MKRANKFFSLLLCAVMCVGMLPTAALAGEGDSDPARPSQQRSGSYTVTFDPNNGAEKSTQEIESNATISRPANPTKNKATFYDWWNPATGTAWNFDTDMVTAPVTLIARYKIDGKIELRVNTDNAKISKYYDNTTYPGFMARSPQLECADKGDRIYLNYQQLPYYTNGTVHEENLTLAVSLVGPDKNKYCLPETASVPAEITPKPLTVNTDGVSISKTYDGTTNPGVMQGTLRLDGIVGSEIVYLYYAGLPYYTSANTGDQILALPVSLIEPQRGNYSIGSTVNIPAKIVSSLRNVSVTQKDALTYNGTAQTAIVTASADQEADFKYSTSKEGEYKGTVPAFTDAGDHTVYYTAEAPNSGTFFGEFVIRIDRKEVSVSNINAKDKTYDGTTSAELDVTDVRIDGLVEGDDLAVSAVGAFDNASAGDHKDVSITGLELSGDDARNYQVANGSQSVTFAKINKRALTITANSEQIICGSELPTFHYEQTGLAAGDSITKVDFECKDAAGNQVDGNTAGEFQITPSNAVFADGKGVNYNITYEDGKLTVYRPSSGDESGTTYFTLTFDTNGGDNIDSVQGTYGTMVDLDKYKPAREGYTFDGWYSDKELTQRITEIELSDNKTVYAGWTAIEPTDEGGTVIEPMNTGGAAGNPAKAVETATKSVKTGDDSNMALWIALMLAALAGVCGTFLYGRKERSLK